MDNDIRKDTLIQVMSGQLGEIKSKLDHTAAIGADVAALKTDVATTKLYMAQALETIVPRLELEARFRPLEEHTKGF